MGGAIHPKGGSVPKHGLPPSDDLHLSISPASILKMSGLAAASSPIAQRLATGGFWALAGEAGSRALSFAAAIVVARLLGAADFGAFALVQSTLFTLATFAGFGMGHTSTRYIAAYRDSDPARAEAVSGVALRFAAAMGLLFAGVLLVGAPYVATTILGASELTTPLRLVAPALILYALSGAMNGILLGLEAFQRLARIVWITSLVNFTAVATGVLIWGLEGAVVALVVGELLRCAMLMLLARETMRANGMRLFGCPRAADVMVLWRFSVPVFLTAVLNVPVLWLCQTIIAKQPGGMTEVGFYNAAQKWMTLVMLVPMAISGAFVPVLSSLSANGDRARFHRATDKLALVQLGLTAVPAAAVAMVAPWAAQAFGQDFAPAAPVIILMIALAPVFTLKHFYWQTLTSGGYAWTSLMLQALWAALAIACTWAWQAGGAFSLAQAMLLAYGVTLGASYMVSKSIFRNEGTALSPPKSPSSVA